MFYRYGIVAVQKHDNTFGLMGLAHTLEEANEIKRRVEKAGLWRDVEVCDGLRELSKYERKHTAQSDVQG